MGRRADHLKEDWVRYSRRVSAIGPAENPHSSIVVNPPSSIRLTSVTTTDASTRQERHQWLVLLCVNLTIAALLIWKFRAGEITRTNAVISAAVCVICANAAALYGFYRRIQRTDGDPVPA